MRTKFACGLVSLVILSGCVVYRDPPPPRQYVVVDAPPPPPAPDVVVAGPVFEGPGVEVVSVEPAPVERVYIYDEGYPPGCYFYGGYYWYGGYRYEHDVFVHRYVEVNVREHRYVNVEENRRYGHQMEQHQRTVYQQTGGRQVCASRDEAPAGTAPPGSAR